MCGLSHKPLLSGDFPLLFHNFFNLSVSIRIRILYSSESLHASVIYSFSVFCVFASSKVNIFKNCFARRDVLVENCRRILELNDVLVRLRTGRLSIQIWGQGLTVTDLNAGGVRVSGEIRNVELTPVGA